MHPHSSHSHSDHEDPLRHASLPSPGSASVDVIATLSSSQTYIPGEEREIDVLDIAVLTGHRHEVLQQLREKSQGGCLGRDAGWLELAIYLVLGDLPRAGAICSLLAKSSVRENESAELHKLGTLLATPVECWGDIVRTHVPRRSHNATTAFWAADLLFQHGGFHQANLQIREVLGRLPEFRPAAELLLRSNAMDWDTRFAIRPLGTCLTVPSEWDSAMILRQHAVAFQRREPETFEESWYARMEFSRRLAQSPPDALRLVRDFSGRPWRVPQLVEFYRKGLRIAGSHLGVLRKTRNSMPKGTENRIPVQASAAVLPPKPPARPPPLSLEQVRVLLERELNDEYRISHLRRALVAGSDNAPTLWGLAISEMRRERYIRAGEYLVDALRDDPRSGPALRDGIRLALARGQTPVAEHLLKELHMASGETSEFKMLEQLLSAARLDACNSILDWSDIRDELEYAALHCGPATALRIWTSIGGLRNAHRDILCWGRDILRSHEMHREAVEITVLLEMMAEAGVVMSTSIGGDPMRWRLVQERTLQRLREFEQSDQESWGADLYAVSMILRGCSTPSAWESARFSPAS